MSSPYSRKTNKGTEEDIEAISRSITWMSRANRGSEVNIDISETVSDLRDEEDRLRELHKKKSTEFAIDNFVFNEEEKVDKIFFGNLDEKVSSIRKVKSYIEENFGYVSSYSLSKEEVIWLVSREVQHRINSRGPDLYKKDRYKDLNLSDKGEKPDQWSKFPEYNRQ